MQPAFHVPTAKSEWTYVSLTLFDGQRVLKPAQVCSDWVLFREPPRINSKQIEILVVNGDDEQRSTADVLPHDAEATRIPIRLVDE